MYSFSAATAFLTFERYLGTWFASFAISTGLPLLRALEALEGRDLGFGYRFSSTKLRSSLRRPSGPRLLGLELGRAELGLELGLELGRAESCSTSPRGLGSRGLAPITRSSPRGLGSRGLAPITRNSPRGLGSHGLAPRLDALRTSRLLERTCGLSPLPQLDDRGRALAILSPPYPPAFRKAPLIGRPGSRGGLASISRAGNNTLPQPLQPNS